jgi:MFS superfamily sulfate permease-like transporter
MEGVLEIILGLFFSNSLVMIFTSFPLFVVGVMLLMTSFELGRVSLKIEGRKDTFVMVVTAILSTVFNIAIGFLGGLLTYIVLEKEIISIDS